MMRRPSKKPEPIVERLLRLGILSEVDEATGRRIAWSDDFRSVARGGPDLKRRAGLQVAMATNDPTAVRAWLAEEATKVRVEREAEWPGRRWMRRPTAEDLIAHELFGPLDGFGSRGVAVLDFLRQVGIVEAVEVDPAIASIHVRLSEPYRRLIEAGREPDREPGFDAAWDEGGPDAVRVWLEQEARKLGASGAPDIAEPGSGPEEGGGPSAVEDFSTLPDLIEQTYGAESSRFMFTPRVSLGGRTPAKALGDGDVAAVWEIVLNDARSESA